MKKKRREGLNLKHTFGLAKMLKWTSPVLNVLHSVSPTARETMSKFSGAFLRLDMHSEGHVVVKGGNIEERTKVWDGPLGQVHEFLQAKLKEEKLAKGTLAQGKAFSEAVAFAMRRGDKHENPRVQAVAEYMRNTLYKPMLKEAMDNGMTTGEVGELLLAEGPEGALSYISRVYDTGKIIQNRFEFTKIIENWLGEEFVKKRAFSEDMQRRLKAYDNAVKKGDDVAIELHEGYIRNLMKKWNGKTSAKAGGKDWLKGARYISEWDYHANADYIDRLADDIVQNIISTNGRRMPYDLFQPGDTTTSTFDGAENWLGYKPGSLNARTLHIPDELIEPYLVNDAVQLTNSYVRSMAVRIEYARMFNGDLDMRQTEMQIKQEYEDARAEAGERGDHKEVARLTKEYVNVIGDIKAVRDRLFGMYKLPDNPEGFLATSGRIARNLNHMRAMGGVLLASIPDIMRPIMVMGIRRAFSDVYIPLFTGSPALKMARDEVKRAGVGLDIVLNTRINNIADLSDEYTFGGKLEKGVGGLTNLFTTMTGINHWNAAMKQITGVMASGRLLDDVALVAKGGKVPTDVLERLASAGIDADLARRIDGQFAKGGEVVDGVKVPSTKDWDDIEARKAFQAAINRDVDMTIITPGQEKPKWVSTEWGKTVFQFQSFATAAMQRLVIAGIQQRDLPAMYGTVMMVGMGMLTYQLREGVIRGEDVPDFSDSPEKWIFEGVDRSGVLGYLPTVIGAMDRLSAGMLNDTFF